LRFSDCLVIQIIDKQTAEVGYTNFNLPLINPDLDPAIAVCESQLLPSRNGIDTIFQLLFFPL
jgi:hypothetical protein